MRKTQVLRNNIVRIQVNLIINKILDKISKFKNYYDKTYMKLCVKYYKNNNVYIIIISLFCYLSTLFFIIAYKPL